MSIKKWLDAHPASVIVALSITIGSTASGTTAYLMKKINDAEKIETVNKYQGQISDLTSRLSSIERRAGPNKEKSYLDVQSMQVPVQEVKNLPGHYKNFDAGRFFVNAPASETWKYSETTEVGVKKLGPFKTMVESFEQLMLLKTTPETVGKIFGIHVRVEVGHSIGLVSGSLG